MTFDNLGLDANMLKTIEKQGFTEPTTIQEKTIPLILKGKDVIGGSSTGSGKTLAFASGIIQNGKKGSLQALILVPTREIAIQITEVFKKLIYNKLSVVTVYGGVSIEKQIKDLKTADIVVATPGRTLDHLSRRTINLKNVRTVVLDEADRMADMGFIDDVTEILSYCKAKEQTLLFSATITPDIKRIAKNFMNNPESIFAEKQVDPSKLTQVYYNTNNKLKISLLVHVLREEESGLVMVFCNKRSTADFVAKQLTKNNLNASAIHGGLTQARRTSTLQKFHSNKIEILVCTDVAARGLDIPYVSHVYNYEVPPDARDYVHRIGRTARAGKEGKVINLIAEADYDNFSRVMYDYKEFKIEKLTTPFVEQAVIVPVTRERFGDRRGGRSGGRSFGRDRDRHYGKRSGDSSSPRNFRGGSRGSRGPRRDNDERPSRGGSRRDNDFRPSRSYGREGRLSDRPHRSFNRDSDSKPRSFRKEGASLDRPKRSFAGASRGPRRDNDSRGSHEASQRKEFDPNRKPASRGGNRRFNKRTYNRR